MVGPPQGVESSPVGSRYYGPVSAYPLGYYRYPQFYGSAYSRATSGYAMGPYPYALPAPGFAETPVYPFLYPYGYGLPWSPVYPFGFGFPLGLGIY
jgi:hypothetical protein